MMNKSSMVMLLGVLLAACHTTAFDHYRNGRRSLELGEYMEAIGYLKDSVSLWERRENRDVAEREGAYECNNRKVVLVRYNGVDFDNYFPALLLGCAHFMLGEFDEALEVWGNSCLEDETVLDVRGHFRSLGEWKKLAKEEIERDIYNVSNILKMAFGNGERSGEEEIAHGRILQDWNMANLKLDDARETNSDMDFITAFRYARSARERLQALSVQDAASKEPEKLSDHGDKYALVIGVERYRDRSWGELRRVLEEVREIHSALESVGFKVTKLEDPASGVVWRELRSMLHLVAPADKVIVYFAGHGLFEEGTAWIVPNDAPDPTAGSDALRAREFFFSALSMDDLIAWSRRLSARDLLIIFNSCYAGTAVSSLVCEDFRGFSSMFKEVSSDGKARIVITAVGNRVAFEDGTFSSALVKGLRGLGYVRDIDNSGRTNRCISARELGTYLREALSRESGKMDPQTCTVFGYHRDMCVVEVED